MVKIRPGVVNAVGGALFEDFPNFCRSARRRGEGAEQARKSIGRGRGEKSGRREGLRDAFAGEPARLCLVWPGSVRRRPQEKDMNGSRYYGVRVEGAKYGVGFGSALAIAISYTNNHSILWAIIDGILGWIYVVFFALFRS